MQENLSFSIINILNKPQRKSKKQLLMKSHYKNFFKPERKPLANSARLYKRSFDPKVIFEPVLL